jgi:NTE family protein
MRSIKLFVMMVWVGLLAGCAAFNYTAEDAPIAKSAPTRLQPAPKIAIVLGSGGPRGYAHIGVIKVLEEAGIKPDLIVGSSVGAVLGAFWASGLKAEEIDKKSMEGGPLTLFDINPFADRGWIRGQRLQDYVNCQLKAQRIEQLPRRLIVVPTQRDNKSPVVFESGNLGVAIRASSAVPGVISPVGILGIEYEDADESLPVAVRVARAAGAQFVIAVDVAAYDNSTPPEVSEANRQRDKNRRARINPEVALADFLVHPDLGYFASPFQSYFVSSRKMGEETMRQQLPALLERLRSKSILISAKEKTP